jgi:predicted nucleic acid-binding Zn ribbon protein
MPVAPAYPYKQDVCTKCGWKSDVVEQRSDCIFVMVRTCPKCGSDTRWQNASMADGVVKRLELIIRMARRMTP